MNLKTSLLIAVFLAGIGYTIAAADVIYVNANAPGPTHDGTSWLSAYLSLQDALDRPPTSGDQIWVAAGTYKPGSSRTDSFEMVNGVTIYGGFPDSGEPNLADRDWQSNETILSGDIGVVGNNADNCYHVIYNRQGTTLDRSAILDGFTITGGNGYGGSPAWGGGMLNFGVSNYPCSPTVTNCTFYDNSGFMGGGMFNISYSSPTLTNCIFYGNGNVATSLGGGLANSVYSTPTVTNCTFYGNTATQWGGGIYSEGYSQPVITNCILWADSSGAAGNEIYHQPDSSPVVTYCDVQGGTGQPWFGTGCIDSDPCFVDATAGDFHLLFSSPCINAGNNSAPNLPPTDFEGDDRILDSTVDMGVDEVLPPYELTTSADPEQAGTIALNPPGGYYSSGTAVTVTANPATGHVFDHWSGDLVSSANPNTIVMDNNKTITAHFTFTGIIYVNDDANGANNGDSWANAFTDLQNALQVANAGLEIWVAAGTYTPDPCGLADPREASFQMKNGVGIYGGFVGDEDPCSFDLADRDFTTNESILSGDIGVVGNNADNCYHVIYNRQGTTLDGSAILDGFTITGSKDYDDRLLFGGGMLNEGASNYPCSPTVTNCIFRDNLAQYGGGMVNTNHSSPTVTNCTFSGNSAYSFHGGGMCNSSSSSPTVTNCTFRDNLAIVGGGMYNDVGSQSTVTNCTFRDNLAAAGGGMGNRTNSSPTVTNCTFSGNEASNNGGGMYNEDNSSPTVTDCNFITNTAAYSGGGIYSENESSPTLSNCIFIGNSATGTYYYNGGGGMFNDNYSSPTVTNCTFSGNEALVNGGGMYNYDSSPTVTSCTFSGNTAGGSGGGGMYNHRRSPTVTNCTFVGNIAPNGGALYNISYSSPTLINCIVYDNSATFAGGGIYNATNSSPVLTNCTFYNNTATTYGGGMYNLENSSPTVTNCILWGDLPDEFYNSSASPTVTYSDVRGGWGDPNDPNNTNIDADPCFVDPNNPDPNLCNLRLKPDSPCIDAGDSTILLAVPIYFDPGGKDRYVDIDSIDDTGSGPWEFLDMGAYEFYCSGIAGDIDCDGVVDFKDLAIFCGNWLAGTEPEL